MTDTSKLTFRPVGHGRYDVRLRGKSAHPANLAETASPEGFNLATLVEMKLPDSGAASTVREPSCSVDPDSWVDRHGDCLYRYALMRVRRPEVAEDLVQETFLAAVRTYANFRGTSSERSWLCGILKNKICDHFRKLAHEVSFTDLEFLEDEMSHKFIDEGWNHDLGPAEWKADPEAALDRKEFWETFRSWTSCHSALQTSLCFERWIARGFARRSGFLRIIFG
jgi:RNA polymerase sigma factor (sigma-70 family)